MKNQFKLVKILIVLSFFACGGAGLESNQLDPNSSSEILIKPQAVINKYLFAKVNPGFEYSQIADCVLVRLNDTLVQAVIPAGTPQMFTLDNKRKSIFYSSDLKKITEYSIQPYTIDPNALAISKDGVIFVSDRGSKSILKFVFDGLTLHYVEKIYSDILVADLVIDENSYLYIADEKINRLIKIDQEGKAANSFKDSELVCNYIDTYKNLDGNNIPLNGLRGIFVDSSGFIYSIADYGRTLIVLQPNGTTEFVLYISPKITVVDVAVTDKIIYLTSNVSNALLLINKVNRHVVGKFEMPEHSHPWDKIDNISKISVYTPYNIFVVLSKEGAEIFTEQYK